MPDFQRLPLFPLNTVLFPGLSLPLNIFEPRYRLMLQRCIEQRNPFGIVLIQAGSEVGESPTVIYSVGTTARVTKAEPTVDDNYLIEVEGETRFVIDDTYDTEPYLTASVTPFWEQVAEPLDLQPLYDQTVTLFKKYLVTLLAEENRHLSQLQMPQDPVLMSFAVAAALQTTLAEKQALLEISSTEERLQREIEILQREREHLEKLDIVDEDSVVLQTFTPLDLSLVHQKMSRN